MQDIRRFHQNFYSTSVKVEQDNFILQHTRNMIPKRKSATIIVSVDKKSKPKAVSIKYFIPRLRQLSGSVQISVCKNTFVNTLGISKFRVQKLCKEQLVTGKSPKENRGGDRKSKLFDVKKNSVKTHIESFVPLESHYCRNNSKRQYLNSDLSIKKMWKLYNASVDDNVKVKYDYYRSLFCTDYNVSFGTPSTDECSKCIELKERIKVEKDFSVKSNLDLELKVHKKRGNAFFELLQTEQPNCIIFSFDCEKNLVLPKIPDQIAYYSRQFYLHNFTVCSGSSKSSQNKLNTFIYTWNELEYKKGSNEIASFLYHRLTNTHFEESVNTIRMFADGCAGQNKNSIVMGMISKWLLTDAPKSITTVEITFPVPGHSYMPPDRIFGHIEKVVKRKNVIVEPAEYLQIFNDYGTVIEAKDIIVYDWKSSVSDVVKPPHSWHFKFAEAKRFILKRFKSKILVKGESSYMVDTSVAKSVCKPTKSAAEISPCQIPVGLPANIKKKKRCD